MATPTHTLCTRVASLKRSYRLDTITQAVQVVTLKQGVTTMLTKDELVNYLVSVHGYSPSDWSDWTAQQITDELKQGDAYDGGNFYQEALDYNNK